MYTVICDSCGNGADEGGDYSCWTDKSTAEYQASNCDWETLGKNHYCPKCFNYDDDDNMIIGKEPNTVTYSQDELIELNKSK